MNRRSFFAALGLAPLVKWLASQTYPPITDVIDNTPVYWNSLRPTYEVTIGPDYREPYPGELDDPRFFTDRAGTIPATKDGEQVMMIKNDGFNTALRNDDRTLRSIGAPLGDSSFG